MHSRPHVTMTFSKGCRPGFSLLLQSGFLVRTSTCGAIRSFLLNQLNLSPEFIEQVIQSVFLDGKPVDDLDSGNVRDGCTLALSAAMPGLVGATMRRGGYYSCLRSSISHREEARQMPNEGGEVTVKLFNLVASELGPALLSCGLWVRSEVAADFFNSRPAGFWAGCESLLVNGRPATQGDLAGVLQNAELVLISIHERDQSPL
jgi:hypothetical protein